MTPEKAMRTYEEGGGIQLKEIKRNEVHTKKRRMIVRGIFDPHSKSRDHPVMRV